MTTNQPPSPQPSQIVTLVMSAEALLEEHRGFISGRVPLPYPITRDNRGRAIDDPNPGYMQQLRDTYWDALIQARNLASREGVDVSDLPDHYSPHRTPEAAATYAAALRTRLPQLPWAQAQASAQRLGNVDLLGWRKSWLFGPKGGYLLLALVVLALMAYGSP